MFGILTCGHEVLVFYNSVCAGVLTKYWDDLGKNKVNLEWRCIIQKAWCYSGAHALLVWESAALSPSPASLGALGGVLSGRLMSLGQVLRAGSAWFITTLSAALRLLSQSHAETASSAKKTLRHRVVCRIRVTSESVFDFIDSSFQSNIGALLEHGTVWS